MTPGSPGSDSASSSASSAPGQSEVESLDAVVVGAGFAGLYMLHRLRGLGLSACVLEKGEGVGGTWYWNRYPGARCDIQSLEYSYQFSEALQQEWDWTERYAPQPEILAYANHVADRFDLRGDIRFNERVVSAHYDEGAPAGDGKSSEGRWLISTERGSRFSSQFCVMATGCLSSPNRPEFVGAEDYRGQTLYTSSWPHTPVDFSGQRVAVIGTGSSGIQSIPVIAEEAAELVVFQRSASYSVPAMNSPLPEEEVARVKADYPGFRKRVLEQPFGSASDAEVAPEAALGVDEETRRSTYERAWKRGGLYFMLSFQDLLLDQASNDTAAEFVRGKIGEIVQDPATAARLMPEQVLGCKRLCVDTDYYKTYNLPHVQLVDVNETPIEAMTPDGIRTTEKEYAFDSIVLATGFDAMTGALLGMDIRGRAGLPLSEKWAEGPKTLLGLMTQGFPNLFMVTGPGSPSVLTNMIPAIEQHVNWIADCLVHLDETAQRTIEPTRAAEEAWAAEVNAIADATLYPQCNSWYLGANVEGKPRVFMPYVGFPSYIERCRDVVAAGYEGFALT